MSLLQVDPNHSSVDQKAPLEDLLFDGYKDFFIAEIIPTLADEDVGRLSRASKRLYHQLSNYSPGLPDFIRKQSDYWLEKEVKEYRRLAACRQLTAIGYYSDVN